MNSVSPTQPRGTFVYVDPDTGKAEFEITSIEFTLFKIVSDPMDESIQLAITITTEPKGDLSPAITTEWLEIHSRDLRSNDNSALDGLTVNYDANTSDLMDPPAALYEGFYGPVEQFKLHLKFVPPGGYALTTSGLDEFGRRFEIDCSAPIFTVGVRNEDGTAHPMAGAWLETHFDTKIMTFGWQHRGPETGGWFDLLAEFNL